ncbi:NAD(P)/FAD-dependent oxidoreductase [Lysobacter soyae]|uniref:NAD(P)/FAD-dependent oxidoreductase n=1 Tax=Lysobacter soyae TaxID=2764185 RepID=A0ABX8WQM0_9GAMM|nr:NAD(P)/FAD-dependent oxidoreductase [Lysobacter sp. CJ11]QYR53127.1 NAD(P)/FAD-dependent oxidoreductase [Lysobacter sp. CJ11]
MNSSASSKPAGAEPLHDVLIIGAGPAGLTAATYLARYRRDIVVVDAGKSRARWIPTSHNCPGFPLGVEGDQLLKCYRDQAANYGVAVTDGCIARLEKLADEAFCATAEDGRRWQARFVILASGVVDEMPAMQGLTEAIDCQAIRLCAVCDAYEASDAHIAVLAPVDEGIRHALFLRSYSERVCVLPTDAEAPDPDLKAEADAANVAIRAPATAMALKEGKTEVSFGDGASALFDTVYPVLGSVAQSGLALALGAKHDDNDELVVGADLETSVPGLYAIGDVVSALNQISVAVGHAAVAATAIHRRLARNFRENQDA